MTKRHCDTGRVECPHVPECIWDCAYESGVIVPMVRKVKAYPVVPEDIDPMPEQWHTMGQFFIGAVFAAIVVFFSLVFFTGFYVLGLLI
jgi:hypothetical protein